MSTATLVRIIYMHRFYSKMAEMMSFVFLLFPFLYCYIYWCYL